MGQRRQRYQDQDRDEFDERIIDITRVAKVVKEAYPDLTALDKKSDYFDEKSSIDNIRWVAVDIKFENFLENRVDLKTLKAIDGLDWKGRLSIMPIAKKVFDRVISLSNKT